MGGYAECILCGILCRFNTCFGVFQSFCTAYLPIPIVFWRPFRLSWHFLPCWLFSVVFVHLGPFLNCLPHQPFLGCFGSFMAFNDQRWVDPYLGGHFQLFPTILPFRPFCAILFWAIFCRLWALSTIFGSFGPLSVTKLFFIILNDRKWTRMAKKKRD